jgi:hypothetical protein
VAAIATTFLFNIHTFLGSLERMGLVKQTIPSFLQSLR